MAAEYKLNIQTNVDRVCGICFDVNFQNIFKMLTCAFVLLYLCHVALSNEP